MRRFFLTSWRFCCALLLITAFAACAGDLPEAKDASPPLADHARVWDVPPTSDAWTFPDLYSGTPFGCQSDADCFGKRCCSTPWKVRLCLDRCRDE